MVVKTRSKFEHDILLSLDKKKVKYKYEGLRIKYSLPQRIYTPDIILDNGIIIELKGYFRASDRQLHKAIKEQHPKLDIRFVFVSANNRIHKASDTTYGDWCTKNGFKFAHKTIPDEWLKEKKGKE